MNGFTKVITLLSSLLLICSCSEEKTNTTKVLRTSATKVKTSGANSLIERDNLSALKKSTLIKKDVEDATIPSWSKNKEVVLTFKFNGEKDINSIYLFDKIVQFECPASLLSSNKQEKSDDQKKEQESSKKPDPKSSLETVELLTMKGQTIYKTQSLKKGTLLALSEQDSYILKVTLKSAPCPKLQIKKSLWIGNSDDVNPIVGYRCDHQIPGSHKNQTLEIVFTKESLSVVQNPSTEQAKLLFGPKTMCGLNLPENIKDEEDLTFINQSSPNRTVWIDGGTNTESKNLKFNEQQHQLYSYHLFIDKEFKDGLLRCHQDAPIKKQNIFNLIQCEKQILDRSHFPHLK